MPKKNIEMTQEIYQLKVTLLGTTPPIWRRLLVPAGMTLRELHRVLQLAMGWENCHLHDFRIGQRQFGEPDPDEMFMGPPTTGNERTTRLFSVLGKVGAKAVYSYDFGDGWEHAIVTEKVLPRQSGLAYPVCTGGQRQAPPEDCGGIPGYYDLLEAISDRNHPRHQELEEWLGGSFDPEAFSIDAVNRTLARLQRRWAKS